MARHQKFLDWYTWYADCSSDKKQHWSHTRNRLIGAMCKVQFSREPIAHASEINGMMALTAERRRRNHHRKRMLNRKRCLKDERLDVHYMNTDSSMITTRKENEKLNLKNSPSA